MDMVDRKYVDFYRILCDWALSCGFYTLIAFLCQNRWIALKWKYFAKKQRGPKVIEGSRFPLTHFVAILRGESLMNLDLKSISDIAIR